MTWMYCSGSKGSRWPNAILCMSTKPYLLSAKFVGARLNRPLKLGNEYALKGCRQLANAAPKDISKYYFSRDYPKSPCAYAQSRSRDVPNQLPIFITSGVYYFWNWIEKKLIENNLERGLQVLIVVNLLF